MSRPGIDNLGPIDAPDRAELHFEMFERNGVWWPANACSRCRKPFAPYGAGVSADDAENYCWGHQIEDAVAPWKAALAGMVQEFDQRTAHFNRRERQIRQTAALNLAVALLEGPEPSLPDDGPRTERKGSDDA